MIYLVSLFLLPPIWYAYREIYFSLKRFYKRHKNRHNYLYSISLMPNSGVESQEINLVSNLTHLKRKAHHPYIRRRA